jgi:hypothetical protein
VTFEKIDMALGQNFLVVLDQSLTVKNATIRGGIIGPRSDNQNPAPVFTVDPGQGTGTVLLEGGQLLARPFSRCGRPPPFPPPGR